MSEAALFRTAFWRTYIHRLACSSMQVTAGIAAVEEELRMRGYRQREPFACSPHGGKLARTVGYGVKLPSPWSRSVWSTGRRDQRGSQ